MDTEFESSITAFKNAEAYLSFFGFKSGSNLDGLTFEKRKPISHGRSFIYDENTVYVNDQAGLKEWGQTYPDDRTRLQTEAIEPLLEFYGVERENNLEASVSAAMTQAFIEDRGIETENNPIDDIARAVKRKLPVHHTSYVDEKIVPQAKTYDRSQTKNKIAEDMEEMIDNTSERAYSWAAIAAATRDFNFPAGED